MMDTERRPDADKKPSSVTAADPGSKNKENEKKKRSRVNAMDTSETRRPDHADKSVSAAEEDPGGKNTENEKKKRSRVKQLLGDVKKQVEFWFSNVNLQKDRFLRQLIDESRDGYIDISVLTTFNRMKQLTCDVKLIARALKNSTLLEVNLEGDKVRRQLPIEDDPQNVDIRTVYVELLPKDVSHGWVERVFAKCGTVSYISIPRYKSSNDPKGFAFVEFATEEQAHKAVEMLNNPPEDAPRKPGLFPKTKNRKPIPPTTAGDPPPAEEAEEKKKRKKKKKKEGAVAEPSAGKVREPKEQEMGTEPSERKKKRSSDVDVSESEVSGAQKTSAKQSDKKRRRSQATEGPEGEDQGEMPPKMRKTSNGGDGEKTKEDMTSDSDMKDDPPAEADKEVVGGEEEVLKAKRKRKKKNKEKLGDEVIPLRVLSKNDWLELKKEYLVLQKKSMATLKKSIAKIEHRNGKGQSMETGDNGVQHDTSKETKKVKEEIKQGPQFTSGVIVKISHTASLPKRQFIKDTLSKVSPVAYVDILEGDAEGHIRFQTPEAAKAIIDGGTEIQKNHNWKLEILSGDHEQRYWQKILVDRQVKLNRPREKKRGTEKLIAKAEKIIMARAKDAHKHLRFLESSNE